MSKLPPQILLAEVHLCWLNSYWQSGPSDSRTFLRLWSHMMCFMSNVLLFIMSNVLSLLLHKFRTMQLLSISLGFKQANNKKGNKVTDPEKCENGLRNTYCWSSIFLVEKKLSILHQTQEHSDLCRWPLYWEMVTLTPKGENLAL